MAVGAAGRVQHMSDEQRSAKATEASLLLRQAAGVQQHLAEVVASSIADTLPADRCDDRVHWRRRRGACMVVCLWCVQWGML